MKTHQHSKTETHLKNKAQPRAQHFYQGDRLTTEVTAQGHRSLMWAPDVAVAQRENEQDSHLLQTDTAGSILALQQIRDLQTMAYSPYGHPGAGNRESLLGFNGQKPDSVTGGYLLGNGNRLYSPVLKRFTRADTLSPFEEGGLNAYCYCEGDPINYHDPLGQSSLILFKFSKALRGMRVTTTNFLRNGINGSTRQPQTTPTPTLQQAATQQQTTLQSTTSNTRNLPRNSATNILPATDPLPHSNPSNNSLASTPINSASKQEYINRSPNRQMKPLLDTKFFAVLAFVTVGGLVGWGLYEFISYSIRQGKELPGYNK